MKFEVDYISEAGEGWLVGGRCDGDIKIDDRFLKAYQNIFEKTLEGYPKRIGIKDIRDVKLQVKEIKAYRHNLDELYSGMTGELYLVGNGGNYLKHRDVLESQ